MSRGAPGRASLGALAAPLLLLLIAGISAQIVNIDVVAGVDPARASQGPSAALWLGADHLGRSVAQRLFIATGGAVGPGLIAALSGLGLGLPLGAACGWWDGGRARVARALIDVLGSLPRFVWVLLFAVLYGDQPAWIGLGVGVAGAPALALALQARIQELRRVSFVEASLLHGVSVAEVLLLHLIGTASRRLILRHLIELFVATVVVEATLGYIGGFGVQEPAPSWGNMIAFSFGQREGNALAWIAPAAALMGVVASGSLLAARVAEGERGPGGGGG